ncbi:MAG TPA: squalene/phytoene synthase family protein [Steroidobacteraceae bacterium]|nr:squalene/phytoene synthase family protein [Steroidobacteraceae bacterium]
MTPDAGRARYFAWLYSPPPQQQILEALLGIEGEIGASLRPGLDHHVAHTRLQWWREECERCAKGQSVHPLTTQLQAAAVGPVTGLAGLVDTAVWDLAGATFETRRELKAYCDRWAAALIPPLLAAQQIADSVAAGAATATATPSPMIAMGSALRELDMLSLLAREAHSGRLRLPLDELERAGLDPGGLARPPWPEPLAKLIAERHAALRADLARAVADLSASEQLTLRGLLAWTALAVRESRQSERALPGVHEPGRLDTLAETWCAWRAARRATTGRYIVN